VPWVVSTMTYSEMLRGHGLVRSCKATSVGPNCPLSLLGEFLGFDSSDMPNGYECGSSSSRGGPSDWANGGCGSSWQTPVQAGASCDADSTCVAFNFDTGDANTPCWKTSAGSDPDNSGDFTGRWIQCKKSASSPAPGPTEAVSLQWTRDLTSASVGLTIPVEFNSSAAETQFYSCTPPSSVSCENDPDGNGFVACPTINGCVTCPSSHPYPAQHWVDDAPFSWMGDKRTVCKTYAQITADRPADAMCTPTGQLDGTYDASMGSSCIRVMKSATYLDNNGTINDYVVRCMVAKHVLCGAVDEYGGRKCASSKSVVLDRIEKCPSDAVCGANAEATYTGATGETLPSVIASFVSGGGNLCAGVASTG